MLASASVFVDVSCDLPITGTLIQEKLTRPGLQSAEEPRCRYHTQAFLSPHHNCSDRWAMVERTSIPHA